MPELRKRRFNQDHLIQNDGLYVHSNPPRVLQINSAYIKQLVRSGDIEKLQNLVLEGQGKRLIGGYSSDYKTRTFLKSVPNMMSKINLLHDAVNSDRLEELQTLLDDESDRKKLVLAKDEAGVGLLHKAVYYNLIDIAKWLIETFPQTVTSKDAEGRTPYHYTPLCRDAASMQKLLASAGAEPSALDNKQHSAKYYMEHTSELELPSSHKLVSSTRKVNSVRDGVIIKKSNIRIWIHQRDLAHLQQVVWEGHGSKLLVEHSNNPKVKKFLEAVPHIMGLIKDIHTNVSNDDLESLKSHSESPIPPIVLSGKDINGLTPLHKAAGLGRHEIAEYIVSTYPNSVFLVDSEGRTPLHYSTLAKDDGKMFDYLLSAGADESALDNKQKTAAYYKTRTVELDHKLLQTVPECPRSAKESFASTFDWGFLTASTPVSEIIPKIPKAAPVESNDNSHAENEIDNKEQEPESEKAEEPVVENGKAEEEEEKPPEAVEEDQEEKADAVDTNEDGEAKEDDDGKVEQSEEKQEEEPEEQKEEEEPKPDSPIVHPDEAEEDEKTEADSAPPDHTNEENGEEEQENESNGNANEATENAEEHIHLNGVSEEPALEHEADPEEGVIEGIVNGENEVESVNEQGQGVAGDDKPDDPEVLSLIEEGNMERLAALVLNGDGDRLIGYQSDNPELQAFLENVATYMSKINKIHVAARDGSLRDLQAALDRRKFAIAKDHISPNGASPLHVATVFGNTSIVRYLAGRFPETVQTADDNGRTALHYAAVLADNGHYYNLLVHLGADMRVEDKFGHIPEYYKENQDELSHRMLLREYGAEEAVDEILNDKVPDDIYSARKDLDDPDMISVLERCYNLLHGRRNSNAISASSHTTTVSDVSTTSVSSKHMKRYIFDTVKLRLTKLDHNFYDIIWPSVKKLPQERAFRVALEQDFPLGIVAPDLYAYKVFQEYLDLIIKEANSIDLHQDFRDQPDIKFFESDEDGTSKYDTEEFDFDLDPYSKWIVTGTLECTRNLADFELPQSLNINQLESAERILTTALLSPETAKALYPNMSEAEIGERGSGSYYTMNEVLEDPSEVRVVLAANGLLIPLWNIPESDRLHGKHWPYGRGVFISSSGNLAAWINVLDHLRIVTCTSADKPGNVGQIYSRVHRLLHSMASNVSFRRDQKLGFLSGRPTALGNTLHFNLTVRFPYLIKEQDNLRHLCTVRSLTFQRCDTSSTDAVRISNQQCLGITELQTFEDFTTAVSNILQLEKDLAMSNSLHIAAMFVNIFRRKKASLVDSNI